MASSASSSRSRSRPEAGAKKGRPTPKRPPAKKRFGCEVPRIWTKPLRKLTPKTSLGFSVIQFAEDVLELELLPWQKWLLIHMLELLPDNSLRFRTVVVLVARQNGKSTLSQVLALWFMYVYGVALVIGTAQDLDVAEEIWAGAVELAEESEDLAPLIEKVVKVNGKKALELAKAEELPNGGGQRYKVKAANRRAGRGLSGDVILLDELREHQSWDAWGAITKTTMARAMALILALSNAGDATSVVLRYLRQMCLKELVEAGETDLAAELDQQYIEQGIEAAEEYANAGEDDSVAIFEWSAPPGCDVWDRDGWAQANPSLGYTITERTIASACRTDPEWIFRTEVLCQWSDGTLEGPFPPGTWDAGRWDPEDPEPPQIVGTVKACVSMSADRVKTYVAFAGHRADGSVQVELVAERAGSEWVVDWLRERAEVIDAVTAQARGAAVSSLMEDLRSDLDGKVDVVDWQGADLPTGTGRFYDLVREGALTHNPWPSLDLAAATAVPKLTDGGAFMWDLRRSPNDAAPLQAATGAVWLLTRPLEEVAVSAYETRRLEVL